MARYHDNSSTINSESYPTSLSDTLIASDVKFNNGPLEAKPKIKRSLFKKKEEDEKFNEEANEQRYKRLMHLLNRSKFYSTYLINKFENNDEEKVTRKRNKRPPVNDENVPPAKKKMKKDIEKYDIQEYMSTEMKEQAQVTQEKKNLSKEEIEAELSIDSDIEEDANVAVNSTVVPKYFCGELLDHQQTGLKWLKLLYENGLSGILADEMGLGKTIQVIAMICHLVEKKQPGPHLIIVPLSTISNWVAEFKRFAPMIPVVLFYGTKEERLDLRVKIRKKYVVDDYMMQPVVITSYEVPVKDSRFFQFVKWRYFVVDEGHRLKNYNCKLYKVLKSVKSMNRLILTGTPLQNDLSELWSLLNFLLPEIFNNLDTFESWFDIKELQDQHGTEKLLKQEKEKQVLSSLREILKPFMLRRMKTDVCLEIPPKKELIVYAPLTELQHDLYKGVLDYDIEMLGKIKTSDLIVPTVNDERPKRRCVLRSKYGSVKEKFENKVSNTSLQEIENDSDDWEIKLGDPEWKRFTDVAERNKHFLVRIQFQNRYTMYKKIVNHPYLVHCPLNSVGLPKIDNDLIRSSGKLLVLDAMLAKLKEQGHKVLLFSTMIMILDVIEDYLSLRNYKYVRLDGLIRCKARDESISTFNNDPDTFLFLISTRAGGIGLNLTGADTIIIYDSDWNPQADIQAMARCHRIGQSKPVVVYRLCTRGTIDEAIINRSEAKRILEKIVISKELKLLNKDALLELKKLMTTKEYKVVTSEKEVFTEMELNKLLDRSDMVINNNDVS